MYCWCRMCRIARRLFALGIIVILFAVPALLRSHDWTRQAGSPLAVAAVQGAVSQDQKWQAKNLEATMARYSQLTVDAWGARLIVWPESALPVLASDIPDYLRRLQEQGRAHGADFAIGLVNYEPKTEQFHNGLLVLSDAGGGWYYKRHLVPFGEYFPVPAFVRSWMRLMSLPYDDITPGTAHQPVLSAAGQKLGLTICYEDAFGSQQLGILREATLLINVTNNAWYGDSTAPHQHLQIARMRALEAGRYLIRAANDGITAVDRAAWGNRGAPAAVSRSRAARRGAADDRSHSLCKVRQLSGCHRRGNIARAGDLAAAGSLDLGTVMLNG